MTSDEFHAYFAGKVKNSKKLTGLEAMWEGEVLKQYQKMGIITPPPQLIEANLASLRDTFVTSVQSNKAVADFLN